MPSNALNRGIPVIGVTGPIGSGKSTVAELFSEWGGTTISGDDVGHKMLEGSRSIQKRLATAFGADILVAGTIDRTLLARRAFAGHAEVVTLNRIVHPALIRAINESIRQCSRKPNIRAIVIDAALLVEWGIGQIHWDYLVGVSSPYGARINRLRARGLSLRQIRQFSKAQMPWTEKRAYCDFVVKNDSTRAFLRRRARLCWDKMLLLNQGVSN